MVLVQIWLFFQLIFLGNKRQKNVFCDILERKNVFLEYKNKKFETTKIWHFSKRVSPWFWSKNGHLSNFIFLGIIGQENVFDDILQRENAFLGYKHKKFEKSKNWHFFPKDQPMVLVQKWPFFLFISLGNIGQENVFYDILEQKNAFLNKKTRNWKSPKIDTFPKGVTHGCGSKIAILPTSIFRQYRPGKCLLRYSTTKKLLSKL